MIKKILNNIKKHMQVHWILYGVYTLLTIIFMIVIYTNFHKDLASENDVIAVYDLSYLMIYSFLSIIILSIIVIIRYVFQDSANKNKGTGIYNILLPSILPVLYISLYVSFNWFSYQEMYFGSFGIGIYDLLFILAAIIISSIIQYYVLLRKKGQNTILEKLLPGIYVISFVFIYYTVGLLLYLYLDNNVSNFEQYLKIEHMFENAMFFLVCITVLLLSRNLHKQYTYLEQE